MGGEHCGHHGGGANYLCLPHNPKYDKCQDGHQGAGYIYGTEYQVSSHSGVPFKRSLHDHEAPCVVCFVNSRGSMLMRPARNDCPSGWTEEYHGYLMTAAAGHPRSSDFICVDGDPEYVPATMPTRMVPCCILWKEDAAVLTGTQSMFLLACQQEWCLAVSCGRKTRLSTMHSIC